MNKKMASSKGSIPEWTVREQLILASAVQRSGDQNWVSVSRAVKPLVEDARPPDYFSQKNCALQYSTMLDKANPPKRKRSSDGVQEAVATVEELIVRHLTEKRMVELCNSIAETKKEYHALKKEIEKIEKGDMDNGLQAMWESIQQELATRDTSDSKSSTKHKAVSSVSTILDEPPAKKHRASTSASTSDDKTKRSEGEKPQPTKLPEKLSESPSSTAQPPQHRISCDEKPSPSPSDKPQETPTTPTSSSSSTPRSISKKKTTDPSSTSLLAGEAGTIHEESPLPCPMTVPKEEQLQVSVSPDQLVRVASHPLNTDMHIIVQQPNVAAISSSGRSPTVQEAMKVNVRGASTVVPTSSMQLLQSLQVKGAVSAISSSSLQAQLVVHQKGQNQTRATAVKVENAGYPENTNATLEGVTASDTVIPTTAESRVSPLSQTQLNVAINSSADPSLRTALKSGLTLSQIHTHSFPTASLPASSSVSFPQSSDSTAATPSQTTTVKMHTQLDTQSLSTPPILTSAPPSLTPSQPSQTSHPDHHSHSHFPSSTSLPPPPLHSSPHTLSPLTSSSTSPTTTIAVVSSVLTDPRLSSASPRLPPTAHTLSTTQNKDTSISKELKLTAKETPTSSSVNSGVEERGGESCVPGEDEERKSLSVSMQEREERSGEGIKVSGLVEKELVRSLEVHDSIVLQSLGSTLRERVEKAKVVVSSQLMETSRYHGASKPTVTVSVDATPDDEVKGHGESDGKSGEGMKVKEVKEEVVREEVVGEENRVEKKTVEEKEMEAKELDVGFNPQMKSTEKKAPMEMEEMFEGASVRMKAEENKVSAENVVEDSVTESRAEEEKEEDKKDLSSQLEGDLDERTSLTVEELIPAEAGSSRRSSISELPSSPLASSLQGLEEGDGETDSLQGRGRRCKQRKPRGGWSRKRRLEMDERMSVESTDLDSEEEPSSHFTSAAPSPAPSQGDGDQEMGMSKKQWKKAIMLVWRHAAQHKYANLFLHPVREEDAPGYRDVIHRPMDLSSIKRNIESGVIRNDTEFQRDMLLMFQNAFMYNSSDHDVYHMAEQMRSDVMESIQDYLSTQLQLIVESSTPKVLRSRDRESKSHEEGTPTPAKKRRTRADD